MSIPVMITITEQFHQKLTSMDRLEHTHIDTHRLAQQFPQQPLLLYNLYHSTDTPYENLQQDRFMNQTRIFQQGLLRFRCQSQTGSAKKKPAKCSDNGLHKLMYLTYHDCECLNEIFNCMCPALCRPTIKKQAYQHPLFLQASLPSVSSASQDTSGN